MAREAHVDPGEAAPCKERQTAQQHTDFRGPGRAEHWRDHAQKDEGPAPNRGEQDEAQVVGGSHRRIIAEACVPR